MALSTTTLTFDSDVTQGVDNTQHSQFVFGKIAISVSPGTYATGGLAISWASELIKAAGATAATLPIPTDVIFYDASGSGFDFRWNKATNKIQVFTGAAAQSALTELTAAATPAGVSGATIRFMARFPRN